MKILGQEKLLNQINVYTYQTFPTSLILLGELGSGKHLISQYIAEKFNLELFDITESISQELINDISLRVLPSLYLIDTSRITERHQNMILKFLEEPTENSVIILLAEDRVNLLPTIINRCIILELEIYSKDILLNFIDGDVDKTLATSVYKTPGQLKMLNSANLLEMKELALKVVKKINIASFSNTLTISSKINYKDEYDKFNINLFFNMLLYIMLEEYKKLNSSKILKMYLLTLEYSKKLRNKKLNKQHLMDNFLSVLWTGAREN